MDDGAIDLKRAAREAAYSMPIEDIDPANAELFRTDTMWPYFRTAAEGRPGPLVGLAGRGRRGYWSVTRYNDIMAVDTDHLRFSSEPTIVLPTRPKTSRCPCSSPWTSRSTTCSARPSARSSRPPA
jgi:cytochrome P450